MLCGGALRQSVIHTPHAHQHCLQLLLDQFGWLLKADFPKLPFPATLPFHAILPAIPAAPHATAGHSDPRLRWPRSASPEQVPHGHRLQG